MWRYDYQNKPYGSHLKDCRLESGRDFKGCEMNETFGWGQETSKKAEPLKGVFAFMAAILGLDSRGYPK